MKIKQLIARRWLAGENRIWLVEANFDQKSKLHFLEWKMAENGSVSGQYEGDNYASPSPSTGSGNSIRQMGGNSKELFDLFFNSISQI